MIRFPRSNPASSQVFFSSSSFSRLRKLPRTPFPFVYSPAVVGCSTFPDVSRKKAPLLLSAPLSPPHCYGRILPTWIPFPPFLIDSPPNTPSLKTKWRCQTLNVPPWAGFYVVFFFSLFFSAIFSLRFFSPSLSPFPGPQPPTNRAACPFTFARQTLCSPRPILNQYLFVFDPRFP